MQCQQNTYITQPTSTLHTTKSLVRILPTTTPNLCHPHPQLRPTNIQIHHRTNSNFAPTYTSTVCPITTPHHFKQRYPQILTFSTAFAFLADLSGVATCQHHKIQTTVGSSNYFIQLPTTCTRIHTQPSSMILKTVHEPRQTHHIISTPTSASHHGHYVLFHHRSNDKSPAMYLVLLLCALLLNILLLRLRWTPTLLPRLCQRPWLTTRRLSLLRRRSRCTF
jgi:hypothetical protein